MELILKIIKDLCNIIITEPINPIAFISSSFLIKFIILNTYLI